MSAPALWTAVRLASFANLTITQDNWRSLWFPRRMPRVWVPSGGLRVTSLSGKIRVSAPRMQQRALAAALSKLGQRLQRLRLPAHLRNDGELWSDFDKGVRQLEPGRLRSFGLLFPASTVVSGPQGRTGYLEGLRRWPDRGRDGGRITYAEMERLHEKTVARLAAICGDKDVSALVVELERYQPPRICFQVRLPGRRDFTDERGRPIPPWHWRRLPPHAHYEHSAPSGAKRRHRAPLYYRDIEGDLVENVESESLADVDGLFVKTLIAGVWSDFYRCEVCPRFAVKKLHGGRETRFCSSACRSKHKRAQDRAKKDDKQRRILEEMRKVGHLPVETQHERMCEMFGLKRRELLKTLKSMREHPRSSPAKG